MSAVHGSRATLDCAIGPDEGSYAERPLKGSVIAQAAITDPLFELVLSSTESRFSRIRGTLRFAILLIRLNGEWRRKWSMRRKRVERVLRRMSIP